MDTPDPETAQRRLPDWLMAALLALATLALYWPATQCGFVNFDDELYVTANAQVQKGLTLENVLWAFANPVSSNWHPLTLLSHELDCQLFGLRPWGHHLTSILLHALNTALVFVLLRRLMRLHSKAAAPSTLNPAAPSTLDLQPSTTLWLCAFAAAVFGWHPLHVESVAWVSERKDMLSTCFFLLALLAYVRFAEERMQRWRRYRRRKAETGKRSDDTLFGVIKDTIGHRHKPAEREERMAFGLCLAAFALGLLCKSMLVTLPFVLLLLDYWPLGRFPISDFRFPILGRLVVEKLPFFALAAAACAATYAVQDQTGAVTAAEAFPLDARVGNALVSYCRYLGKFFWPADLAVYYPLPVHWPVGEVLLAAAFLSGVSVFLFMQRNRQPWMLMGWLWFLGTLVPVIGLVQVGRQAMADRYLYIPSIGLLILVIWSADSLCQSWRPATAATLNPQPSTLNRVGLWALSVAGAAALVGCCILTRQQLAYWKSSETLWQRAIAVTKNNAIALANLGHACFVQGRVDEAIVHCQESVRLDPELVIGHVNLGVALLKRGRLDEAVSEQQAALKLQPDNEDAHYNLGLALLRKGQRDEAISELQEAVRLKPTDTDAQRDLTKAMNNLSEGVWTGRMQ